MIDTHTHMYAEQFDEDRADAMQRAFDKGVERLYLPAIDSETHEAMLALEAKYPGKVFAMMGLHPTSVQPDTWKQELDLVEKYLSQRDFCAIGEIGIDLHWDRSTLDIQKQAFEKQIDWAIEKDLPIVIHTRKSFQEIFEVLERKKHPKLRGVFHCFGGGINEAKKAIDLGFLLGIGGVVTFSNSKLGEVLKQIPLEYIVLETDSPYLTPSPHRGKRNESSYLEYIAGKLVDVYGLSFEEINKVTTSNANALFGFKC